MYKFLFFLLTIFSLHGCVSIPDYNTSMKSIYNVPSSGLSEFDGTKHIRMSNLACPNMVMFELYQDTSKSRNGTVLLKAGSKSITNIANGKSLFIKLDGKLHSFKSSDSLTEHESIPLGYGVNMHFSHKTYVVTEKFIREVAASNVFLSKVHLLNSTYIEGKCSPVTLQETKDRNKNLGYNLEIRQEHVDSANKFVALNGFREFVRMMDTTKW